MNRVLRLVSVFALCLLSVAFAPASLGASPPIGAVVQTSQYDAAKGIVTFSVLNTSHKDISAYSMQVRITHSDGTVSTWEYGGDFLPYMIATGGGAPAPGATFKIDVPLGQQQVQTASAFVDVVVYADATADVLNEQVFMSIISARKGRMLGLQTASELLQNALADPNDPHPSIIVAAKLRALAEKYETNPSKGNEDEGLGLLDAATNISNAPKSTGRSEKEDGYLRALIKKHHELIALMLPHTQLTKVVQP
jgi:hypothetical protein